MAETTIIYANNGNYAYVSNMEDFIAFVGQCMGADAMNYLREQMTEMELLRSDVKRLESVTHVHIRHNPSKG